MQNPTPEELIEQAIRRVDEMSPKQTDGRWLEDLTAQMAPYIKEWDIRDCWRWTDWPEREELFPNTTRQDIGVDAVAIRRSDGEYIAIQCKSRKLDEHGHGDSVDIRELSTFIADTADDFWAERWLLANGDVALGGKTSQVPGLHRKPIKEVNIAADLRQQRPAFIDDECPHCVLPPNPDPDAEQPRRTISCMQNEAVADSVRILKQHVHSTSGGSPVGQARGRLILPCGTGKTRVSLRIIEELTAPGELAIVLCPSIALVAQIRREYLQNATTDIRALAVCSDQTAGYDPRKEGARSVADDPTIDNSNVSASVVKGLVTTDPQEIARWIREGEGDPDHISVLFGTYQSGRPVADALAETGVTAKVLIADEAHRTAGLRRKRGRGNGEVSEEDRRIRDFTLCHENDEMPATYRVYQTATPRIYDTRKVNRDLPSDYVVRTMDDETVFGVELYRKSYVEAVTNGWLADYRIIAVGVNDPEAYRQANELAIKTQSTGRLALTTTHYLKGLAFALAMGGATHGEENGNVPIKSCIAFMNTIDKSKNMAQDLQTDTVRTWLENWLRDNRDGQAPAQYRLEHLDASSNVTARDNAKSRLAEAGEANPYSIINVGIFGEGTDAPALNAVAFLEPRKSPIDVIQAVGRAMRTAHGKDLGYVICPIQIPPDADPEQWLSTSNKEEGWEELGQILLALRAHDQRIEDNLADLLQIYVPKPPEVQQTLVAVAMPESKRIITGIHEGPPGEAQEAVERVTEGKSTFAQEFQPIPRVEPAQAAPTTSDPADAEALLYPLAGSGKTAEPQAVGETKLVYEVQPTQIITGKKNEGSDEPELRIDTIVRAAPAKDGAPGPVDYEKSKVQARKMINDGIGIRLPVRDRKPRRTREEMAELSAMRMLRLSGLEEHGSAIRMNLLAKSGLVNNRIIRDLNILEDSIKEASHHLRADDLQPDLDRLFGLDNLKESDLNKQADGCTIAALLMMNAAMLHQRIANGRWLPGVSDLAAIKNDVNVVRRIGREWFQILSHDFRPVIEPALKAIQTVEDSGKLAGLERALHHIAAEAERIAETYADMGADHAGPLFNRVMGNQASDGAYFTRPVAASIAARLTLDACGDVDWTDSAVWRDHKTVDLACGSGTLLAAMLADMKRRAREQGATDAQLAELQRLAVEDTLKGLDINPVSLQLAAAQLTAGNRNTRYRRMGLHQMPYGPQAGNATGTLELLGQSSIVPRPGKMDLGDDAIKSQAIWEEQDNYELEDAVDAVKNPRIIIMNPPFSNRSKMGEKFPVAAQQALRNRTDALESALVQSDPELANFASRNTVAPCFVMLADRCLPQDIGVFTMINPTIALSAPSGVDERLILARRYHIHTVLTGRQAREFTMSQNTEIDESIIVMRRHGTGPKPPTRFIMIDKMPVGDYEVADLHAALSGMQVRDLIPNGWGQVSYWPAERMEAGDWTPAIWRSPELAEAAYSYANSTQMITIRDAKIPPVQTGRQLFSPPFKQSEHGHPDSFPLIRSKNATGQMTITSKPDGYWRDTSTTKSGMASLLVHAGHLLIADGHGSSTGRLMAVAADEKYVGISWMPMPAITAEEGKALAVFINSTPGRLQLMNNIGRKLRFPMYRPAGVSNVRVPNIADDHIRGILADCWERTKEMVVPQFRDGECEVRRLWDEAVGEAMGWDTEELARLRNLLHQEPHVRGLGYNQYGGEAEEDEELADDLSPEDE